MNAKIHKKFGSKPIVWVAAWGISKLRKRGGRFGGAIAGEALWYDQWYDRVMSEATADKFAELGVNLVILPFSLGGNDRIEQQERDDFERMTGFLHQRGIVAIPYLQYQNILQEAFTFPQTTWAVQLNGGYKGFGYWRRTACQSQPEFVEFFKGLFSDAIRRGADGIWIDNNYLTACRCEICQNLFREWLTENRRDLLQELFLENFDRVELPTGVIATFDPIVQAYNEFNCRRNLDIHLTLKEHLEQLDPDALFGSNPGIYRGNTTEHIYGKGLDFRALIGLNDLMYLENKFFPGEQDNQTTGNYHGFIACEACGAMGIPGGWRHEDFDSTTYTTDYNGFPANEDDIRRVLFEATAFGGAQGMVWAVRTRPEHMCKSPDDLLTMYFEHPTVLAATRKTLKFIHSLPAFGEARNLANIAILQQRTSLAFNGPESCAAQHAAEEMLQRAALPYNILFSEDFADKAQDYSLIIMPEVAAMSDAEAAAITAYVEHGGQVMILGNAGLYNERMRTRQEFALKDLTGVSRFDRPDRITLQRRGRGNVACLPTAGPSKVEINKIMSTPPLYFPRWYAAREEIMAAIDRMLGRQRQVFLEGPAGATVGLRTAADGATAIHIFSYTTHAQGLEVKLRVNQALVRTEDAVWHTPDADPVKMNAQPADDQYVRFTLPGFRDYGLMIT